MLSLIIIGWLACGLFAYSACIGYFAGEFQWAKAPYGLAIVVGAAGPVGVLTAAICSDLFKHGFKLHYTPTISLEEYERKKILGGTKGE